MIALNFGSAHALVVASTNKVVPTLEDAMRRAGEVARPRERDRMRAAGVASGSLLAKWSIVEREFGGRIHVVLVDEPLGSEAAQAPKGSCPSGAERGRMLRRRSRASMPLFLVGLSLIASGIGWDWAPLWIVGLAVFAVGIALLARQQKRNAIWRG